MAFSWIFDLAFVALGALHVFVAPYTKVEESFNLHAIHDFLFYGFSHVEKWDHNIFPGAVPRSFIGPIVVGSVVRPISRLVQWIQPGIITSKSDVLILVRIILATLNALSLAFLRRAISKRFGLLTSNLFALITLSQCHLLFWMGRTIPNSFALIPVNVANALFISGQTRATPIERWRTYTGLALMTVSAAILRAELALYIVPQALQAIFTRRVGLVNAVKLGALVSICAIAATVFVDTPLWYPNPNERTLLWPEFESLKFNVIEGHASEWGSYPVHYYLTSAIPKVMLAALPLLPLGLVFDSRLWTITTPSLAFIGMISALDHKEWRFIMYTIPILNLAAAVGARSILRLRWFRPLPSLIVLGVLAINIIGTFTLTSISASNYPGGVALTRFNELYQGIPNVHVHIDNYAAQTGASLFLQENSAPVLSALLNPESPATHTSSWVYNKTEHILTEAFLPSSSLYFQAKHFTHLIVEDDTASILDIEQLKGTRVWNRVEGIRAYDRVVLNRSLDFSRDEKDDLWSWVMKWWPVQIVFNEKLWIMERI